MCAFFPGEDAILMPPPSELHYLLFKFFRKHGRAPKPNEINIPVGDAVLTYMTYGPKPKDPVVRAAPDVILIDD